MRNSHASFFSGVGGMDLGLERAGWNTVSFSEIDPYACAVLAARWPEVPNIGDIGWLQPLDVQRWDRTDTERQCPPQPTHTIQVAGGIDGQPEGGRSVTTIDKQPDSSDGVRRADGTSELQRVGSERGRDTYDSGGRGDTGDWTAATLWSGGFPCQDLSMAGNRAGLSGERSGLALTFLALADTFRPEWILLENVTGLLSSNKGRDMAKLFHLLEESGYGWAYRVFDSQRFRVPQRRRRVFILAHTLDGHPDYLGPGEILAVGTRCEGHPYTRRKTGKETARTSGNSTVVDQGHSLTGGGADSPQGERVWSVDGQAPTLDTGRAPWLLGANTSDHARGQGGWREGSTDIGGLEPDAIDIPDADTVSGTGYRAPVDPGRVRAVDELARRTYDRAGLEGPFVTSGPKMIDGSGYHRERLATDTTPTVTAYEQPMLITHDNTPSDDLLPLGLDSNRYRVIGNGVVSNVAEWIGGRILRYAQA